MTSLRKLTNNLNHEATLSDGAWDLLSTPWSYYDGAVLHAESAAQNNTTLNDSSPFVKTLNGTNRDENFAVNWEFLTRPDRNVSVTVDGQMGKDRVSVGGNILNHKVTRFSDGSIRLSMKDNQGNNNTLNLKNIELVTMQAPNSSPVNFSLNSAVSVKGNSNTSGDRKDHLGVLEGNASMVGDVGIDHFHLENLRLIPHSEGTIRISKFELGVDKIVMKESEKTAISKALNSTNNQLGYLTFHDSAFTDRLFTVNTSNRARELSLADFRFV